MATTGNFGYAYNAGANVIIALNDQAVYEAVGISYNVMDSMAPIYGYSSRLFDAVAPGQKLIQGSFVINYVAPNYIFAMAKMGADKQEQLIAANVAKNMGSSSVEKMKGDVNKRAQQLVSKLQKGGNQKMLEADMREAAAMKEHFWGPADPGAGTDLVAYDSTLMGPNRIQIFFGGADRMNAKHLIEIHGVYIIGHGSAIQADENVVLEEYNFIGRELIKAGIE